MMKFEHKFEYEWGGEDTWYTKSKRWAKKQNPIIRSLALGFIEREEYERLLKEEIER